MDSTSAVLLNRQFVEEIGQGRLLESVLHSLLSTQQDRGDRLLGFRGLGPGDTRL